MTRPGWYTDPGGQPGMFRWWDGGQWTPTLSADPAAPPPAFGQPTPPGTPGRPGGQGMGAPLQGGGSQPLLPMRESAAGAGTPASGYYDQADQRRSGRGPLLVLGIVGVLLVALVVGGFNLITGNLNPFGGGPGPASNPTADVCPRQRPQTESPQPHVNPAGRVQGGKLSYPRLGGPWGPVAEETRVPFGRDVYGQSVPIETNYDGRGSSWVASLVVGELVAGDGFFSPQQGSEIVTRCVLGVFYGDAQVERRDVRNEAASVGGKDAWLVEMHLSFDIRGLREKGETAIILIVATGEDSSSLYYASIPDSRPDLLDQARRVQTQLRVEP